MLWFRLDDAKAYPRAEELPRAILWNLDGVSFSADCGEISMIDDIDGLPDYADDIPDDHDSKEYEEWYWNNKSRIVKELLQANEEIETYLSEIDKKNRSFKDLVII